MKLGYKIAIGTAIGFGVGFGVWKIIYNHRLNTAKATQNQQKELLIQQILILQGIPDTEANRKLWMNKSVDELNQYLNQNMRQYEPADENTFYDPTDNNRQEIESYQYIEVSDVVGGYYSDYSDYSY